MIYYWLINTSAKVIIFELFFSSGEDDISAETKTYEQKKKNFDNIETVLTI